MKFERGKDPAKSMGLGIEGEMDIFLSGIWQLSKKRMHQLQQCILHGKAEFVEYLLKEVGIKPSITCLQIAINEANLDIINLILDVDPKLKNYLQITHYRYKKLDPEIKKILES